MEMSDKELVLNWLEHDFAYPGYQKACDAFERILGRIEDLDEKLKGEAEGHEAWEQEHLRHDAIHRAAFKQIMGLCEPNTAIYQIAKQALHIEP